MTRRAALSMTLTALAVAGCTSGPPQDEEVGPLTAGDAFDAATRDDAQFNATFAHRFQDVDDLRMHYVVGGRGEPLVLLHGWPQTWYKWREVMPALAQRYTVYAVDLPGLGDSRGTPSGYDKATLAGYVHGLLDGGLGLPRVRLVAHDLGAGVGHQYAARFPEQLAAYAHLDYPLPGPALSAQQYRTYSWHVAFQSQPHIPEMLVDDEVRDYLASFYPQVAYGGAAYGGTRSEAPFSDAVIDEFARTYARPEVLRGGFELYRTLDDDERDNTAAGATRVPTLFLGAEGSLAGALPTIQPLVGDLRGAVEVPRSGHWLAEEAPEFVTAQLLDFFGTT